METKKWYLSVTIWSALFSVLSGIFASVPSLQEFFSNPDAAQQAASAASAISALITIWGRGRASTSIERKIV